MFCICAILSVIDFMNEYYVVHYIDYISHILDISLVKLAIIDNTDYVR